MVINASEKLPRWCLIIFLSWRDKGVFRQVDTGTPRSFFSKELLFQPAQGQALLCTLKPPYLAVAITDYIYARGLIC